MCAVGQITMFTSWTTSGKAMIHVGMVYFLDDFWIEVRLFRKITSHVD